MHKRVIKRTKGVSKAQGMIPEGGINIPIRLTIGKPWSAGKMTIPEGMLPF